MTDENETVRTSQVDWIATLARIYKERRSVLLVDDGQFGIDPTWQTLFDMARRVGLSKKESAALWIAGGMSAAGIGMIVLAFVDPEPTSKLGLLLGGGVICILGGGFTAIRTVTNDKPPNIKLTLKGFQISWT